MYYISIVHLPWSQKHHQKPDNKNFQTSCSRSTSTSFAEGTSILVDMKKTSFSLVRLAGYWLQQDLVPQEVDTGKKQKGGMDIGMQVVYMRVEQKVHERGFLCVSLWVCN